MPDPYKERGIPPFGVKSDFRPFKTPRINGEIKNPRYDNWSGRQITVSEGHPFYSMKGKKGMQDLGGPFYSRTIRLAEVSHPARDYYFREFVFDKNVTNGHILPIALPKLAIDKAKGDITGMPYGNPSSTDAELIALGTTAIARCSPVKPAVDLSVALKELFKEGLPTIPGIKSLKEGGKGTASDYLNYQFGIMPLWSDIQKTAKAFKNADKLLKQLERDSGRLVRRRYEFPIETKTTTQTIPMGLGKHMPDITGMSAYLIQGGMGGLSNGIYTVTTTTEKKQWFSGAFTYHYPGITDAGGWARMVADADRVYGLRPNVDTVWNVMPWSWALDWFANTGDVLQNTSALTEWGQLLRYGYMMETTTCTTTHTVQNVRFSRGGLDGEPFSVTFVDVIKKRVQATPYGFGTSFGSLNAYQLSILAAIGITRF